ncbi:MAG: hypothetical protein WBL27_00940 [Salinimicrobium sp.]
MRKKLFIQILGVALIAALVALATSETGFIGQGEKKAENNNTGLLKSASGEILALEVADFSVAVKKDTNVLLTVDTEKINDANHDVTVTISDDRSDSSESSRKPSDHITLVDKNMKIYWRAEALDPQLGTTVDVLGIFRKTEGGAEILEASFRDPNKDGVVMGKIKNKKVEGLEYYNILIRVNGENPKTFLIDPKLKMTN